MAAASRRSSGLQGVPGGRADYAQLAGGADVPRVGARIEPDLVGTAKFRIAGLRSEDGHAAAVGVDQRDSVVARAEELMGCRIEIETGWPPIAASHIDAAQKDEPSGLRI